MNKFMLSSWHFCTRVCSYFCISSHFSWIFKVQAIQYTWNTMIVIQTSYTVLANKGFNVHSFIYKHHDARFHSTFSDFQLFFSTSRKKYWISVKAKWKLSLFGTYNTKKYKIPKKCPFFKWWNLSIMTQRPKKWCL